MNTAPLLYLMDKVNTFEDGIAMARQAIRNQAALTKLRDWVQWQNIKPEDGLPTLDSMITKAA